VAGQSVFQKYGLMDYGTMFGHGGYRGPDFSADTLHKLTLHLRDIYAQEKGAAAFSDLSETDRAIVADRVITELKTNRYDNATGAVTITPAYAQAFETPRGLKPTLFSKTGEGYSPPRQLHS
jgi:nitric oxide reductase subunit B